MIVGKTITDLSLNTTASPNVTNISDWTVGTVWGRARIVNDWFYVCGGVTLANRKDVFSCYHILIGITHT